jgi:hypothetical protein
MGRCDEGRHVVNFSKTRVGIGLGDGEVPHRDLEVRGKMRVGTGLHNFKGSESSGTGANEPTLEVSDLGGSRASPIATVLQITNAHPGGSGWNTSSSFAKLAFATVDGSGPGHGGIVGSIGMTCTAGGGGDDSRLIFATDSGEDHSEKMCIDKSGNVGIGTTNPGEHLHIYHPTHEVHRSVYWSELPGSGSAKIKMGYLGSSNPSYASGALGLFKNSYEGQTEDEAVRIQANGVSWFNGGNVGIGTNNPNMQLDCYVGSAAYGGMQVRSSSGAFAKLIANPAVGGHNSIVQAGDLGIVFSTDNNAASHEAGKGFYIAPWASATSGLRIDENGNVGIGTASPACPLHVKFTTNAARSSGTRFEDANTTNYWENWINNGDYFYFAYNGSDRGWIQGPNGPSATKMPNFTGQHMTFIKDIPFTRATECEGLIVSSDQNKYIKMNGGIEAGSNAITINECLPVVSLSNVTSDKKCFGVISASEDPETRTVLYGAWGSVAEKEKGDTRVYINSVGEGAIWVTNLNGTLESGDYITTSNVVGYGQKQESEFLANYTVAKITMDCDFEPVTQPIQNIKKELQDVNYWFKMRYDPITEADFSNLIEENRRTITETVYTNENNQISVGEYSNLESNIQSTYSELTETTYEKITKEESKTEQEGYELEVRQELVNVLDEHGQIQWEDHATETEKAYKIRYLDANGVITDEASAVHTAAFVGCTYHCG